VTYHGTILTQHRKAWDAKAVLRHIYGDFHRRILGACRPGLTVEIGAGLGCLKSAAPEVVCIDIQMAPWLDLTADAQRLPFVDARVDNIVMIDVLHHIERPYRFFTEAARVLKLGGQLVMLEPAITFGSWPFYRFFHHEPVDMAADPLAEGKPSPNRDPYHANQAIPTLLFKGRPSPFETAFAEFEVAERTWLSFLAYPLSGGYQPWSLIPLWMVRPLLGLESLLEPLLGHLFGFRLFLVLRKR
jgi:SAM-dependent methyltransferase